MHSLWTPLNLNLASAMCNRRQCTRPVGFSIRCSDRVVDRRSSYVPISTHAVSSTFNSRSGRIAWPSTVPDAPPVPNNIPSSLLGLTRYAPRMADWAIPTTSAFLQPHLLHRHFVSAAASSSSLGASQADSAKKADHRTRLISPVGSSELCPLIVDE